MKGNGVNYTGSFGLSWKMFANTQLGSANGTTISRDRFFQITGWTEGQFRAKVVADLGRGMGRLAEVALSMDPQKADSHGRLRCWFGFWLPLSFFLRKIRLAGITISDVCCRERE